jgi:hypothetical protein
VTIIPLSRSSSISFPHREHRLCAVLRRHWQPDLSMPRLVRIWGCSSVVQFLTHGPVSDNHVAHLWAIKLVCTFLLKRHARAGYAVKRLSYLALTNVTAREQNQFPVLHFCFFSPHGLFGQHLSHFVLIPWRSEGAVFPSPKPVEVQLLFFLNLSPVLARC